MNPDVGFVIAGLLFLIAIIAGVGLLLLAACVALRVGGYVLLDQLTDADEADPATVLAQLLADLAHHHQQRAGRADQTADPPVIDITAVHRTNPRSSRTDR